MDAENEDGRWLTYAELAELRGISKNSATRMSFRHKWRRQEGNDGTARVFVPASALRDKAPGSDMARMTAAMEAAMELFQAERGRAEAAEARADRAEAGREAAGRRADEERSRADRAEAEREAADRRADALQGELQRAKEEAEERRKAEADRKARGRLARLRAAWRGE